jgi:hypothetical protein
MELHMKYLTTVTALVAPGKYGIIDYLTHDTAQGAYRWARSRSRLALAGWDAYAADMTLPVIFTINRIVERDSAMPFMGVHLEHVETDSVSGRRP